MAKEIYVEVHTTKKVLIDLTGHDVNMTDPRSVEEYVNLYASGDIDCHEDIIDYRWEVTDYAVKNKKRKGQK